MARFDSSLSAGSHERRVSFIDHRNVVLGQINIGHNFGHYGPRVIQKELIHAVSGDQALPRRFNSRSTARAIEFCTLMELKPSALRWPVLNPRPQSREPPALHTQSLRPPLQ